MPRRHILFEVFKNNLTIVVRVMFEFRGKQRSIGNATQTRDKQRI